MKLQRCWDNLPGGLRNTVGLAIKRLGSRSARIIVVLELQRLRREIRREIRQTLGNGSMARREGRRIEGIFARMIDEQARDTHDVS